MTNKILRLLYRRARRERAEILLPRCGWPVTDARVTAAGSWAGCKTGTKGWQGRAAWVEEHRRILRLIDGRLIVAACGYFLTTNNPMVMNGGVRKTADNLFKTLADPTRRAIFERLMREGQQTVHALTQGAGVSQPMVSKHLSALKRARLVRPQRRGRETHYSAQPKALAPVADWVREYSRFWQGRLESLENLLQRMEP